MKPVRTIAEIMKIWDAMWLLGIQTHTVTVYEDKNATVFPTPRIMRLRKELKKRKIPHDGSCWAISLHLPYKHFNPYNSKKLWEPK